MKDNHCREKGFTLAELLVVVAIVGILVAISVPLFTAQLGKARKATNEANMRAAKIAATAQYLVNANDGKEVYYTYNLEKGTVTSLKHMRVQKKTNMMLRISKMQIHPEYIRTL